MVQKLDKNPDKGGVYDEGQPSWYKPEHDSLEEDFAKPDATDEDLPPGHPDRESLGSKSLETAEQHTNRAKATKEEKAEKKLLQKEDEDEDEDDDESLYKEEGSKRSTRRRLFTPRRLIGAGAISLLGGGGIALLIFLAPILKLESFLAKINQRAFALAAGAVEARAEHLFERYLISHVINLDTCGNVVNNMCRDPIAGVGLTGGLYTAWRDARIEEKLFDRYGIEVESLKNPDTTNGTTQRYRIKDRFGRQVILTNSDLKSGAFTGGNREIGRDLRRFFRQETKWYEVMHRRSVRNYLSRKHGINLWCFLACKTRDKVDATVADARVRYKYRFVERLVYPFSGKYGFILDCIISGTPGSGKCSAESLRERGVDRNRVPDEDIDDITKFFNDNPNARTTHYVLEKLIAKVMGQQTAKTAISAIPVAGQIYFAVSVVDMVDRVDTFIANRGLSKFAAEINAAQYLEFYAAMRSNNDELKSHALSLTEIGVVGDDYTDANQSLVYQARNQTSSTAMEGSDGTVDEDNPYLCVNGNPIPEGKFVCPEKTFTKTFAIEDIRNNNIIDSIVDLVNSYGRCIGSEIFGRCPQGEPRDYIRPILNAINSISDAILSPLVSAAISVAKAIPGVGGVIDAIQGKFTEIVQGLLGKVFPLPCQLDSPDRDKYDCLEGGAEVASSEFGKGGYTDTNIPYGVGAPPISDEDATGVLEDQFEQQAYEYRRSSLFAKISNLEYSGSLGNKLVAAVPSSLNQIPSRIMSGFSSMGRSLFKPLFGSKVVHAETLAEQQLSINPFGITRYGYALDDPAITRNPEELTEASCGPEEEIRKVWEASRTEDPITGFETYSQPNPCLLEYVSIEAAGAYFTNN